MLNVQVVCFLASYVVAFGLELTRLIRSTPINRVLMLLFGLAGLVAHTLYLLGRSGQTNLPPLLSSPHDWMLVLAWLAIVLYLFLTAFDRKLAIGLFLLPLVLILIGSTYFVSKDTNTLYVDDPQTHQAALYHWGMLHASLLMLGMGGVIVGFVLSMMFLVQHRRLKHKRTLFDGLRLPSLARLARWNRRAILCSILLFTLGMATGLGLGWFSNSDAMQVSFSDPVVTVTGAVWLLMMLFFGWLLRSENAAGKQVAWRTIWAFGFLLVTLIVMQVLTGGSTVHTRQSQLPRATLFVGGWS